MQLEVNSETIQFVWEALQKYKKPSRNFDAEKYFVKYLNQGWIFMSDIEDFILLLDGRIDFYIINVYNFVEALGIPIEMVNYRPKKIANSVIEFKAIQIEYFTFFLILLERMGFQIDALRYVDLVLSRVENRSKKIFSFAETEIFWYKKHRLKTADIILTSANSRIFWELDKKVVLDSCYKLSLYINRENNDDLKLTIRSPKYRKRPSPTFTKCSLCGYEWYKGDPESSLSHRKEHKLRLTWLCPKPIPEMIKALEKEKCDAEHVTFQSESWKHREMYNRARAFKREFNYDFIQWDEDGNEEEDAHGFLFTGENGEIIGAAAFRNRIINDKQRWGLQWIWFCPSERRKGHLDKRWPYLREKFEEFIVESPVSDAMKSFLEKQGDIKLINY